MEGMDDATFVSDITARQRVGFKVWLKARTGNRLIYVLSWPLPQLEESLRRMTQLDRRIVDIDLDEHTSVLTVEVIEAVGTVDHVAHDMQEFFASQRWSYEGDLPQGGQQQLHTDQQEAPGKTFQDWVDGLNHPEESVSDATSSVQPEQTDPLTEFLGQLDEGLKELFGDATASIPDDVTRTVGKIGGWAGSFFAGLTDDKFKDMFMDTMRDQRRHPER